MQFSILLYTYGDENTVLSVLESINNQTNQDFECFVLDDCSQDSTQQICTEFCNINNKFTYMRSDFDKKKKNERDKAGISILLNSGIEKSTGDYIVFCNGKDQLHLTRLEQTLKDFNDTGLDIIAYHRNFGDELFDTYSNTKEDTINKLIENGVPSLWTTAFARERVLQNIQWLFRQPFDKIFATQFFMTAISHKLTLGWSLDEVNNIPIYTNNESDELQQRYLQMFLPENQNKSSNEMTVLITFKDESIEVEKTVIAVRLNDQNVNIQMVNDASTDSYDYKNIADTFGCDYIVNETSQGCAGARTIGIDQIKTPYFIIFDAHMRFKVSDRDFSKMFLDELKKDDRQILYANTFMISSDTSQNTLYRTYNNEDCLSPGVGHNTFAAYGAGFRTDDTPDYWQTIWRSKFLSEQDRDNDDPMAIIETASILGATYAMSKNWWSYIHGVSGLYYWGSDEAWLSIKTFLLGGKCRMFKNFGIGHLYRQTPSYGSLSLYPVQANLLMIQYILTRTRVGFNHYLKLLRDKWPNYADRIIAEFYKHIEEHAKNKKWLLENSVRTIKELKEYNEKFIINA